MVSYPSVSQTSFSLHLFVAEEFSQGAEYGFRAFLLHPMSCAVEKGDTQAAVDVTVVVEYGASIVEVGNAIRRNIIEQVEGTTGLEVIEVNVNVVECNADTAFHTVENKVLGSAIATHKSTAKDEASRLALIALGVQY